MAVEFHCKTAALFDEFRKRELHFLNTAVNLNSNVSWKNNINTPIQEYLQKINKREQETEKTYKNLMRQMEDLSNKTDQMTLNLEKLNALRNVALSSNISAWPTDATFDRPSQSYCSNGLFQTAPKMLSTNIPISDFPPRIQPDLSFINHSFQHSSSKPNFHSATTQTEYIFCDNCHFPLILNSEMPAADLNLARTSDKIVTKESEQNLPHNPAKSQENAEFSKNTTFTKSAVISKSNCSFFDPQLNDHDDSILRNEKISEKSEIRKKNDLINEQVGHRISKSYFDSVVTDEFMSESTQKRIFEKSESYTENAVVDGLANELVQKSMSQSYTDHVINDELTNAPVHKKMSQSYTDNVVNDELTNAHVHKKMSQSYTDNVVNDELTNAPVHEKMSQSFIDNVVTGDYVTHTEEKQYIEIQDNDLLSNDGNFVQTISKSDDESMSHEFNFLDSDKNKTPKRQPFHQISGDTNGQLIEGGKYHENTQLKTSNATQSNPNLLKVQSTSESSEKIEVSGKGLSYTVGAHSPYAHSENTSIVSESDSFSETETPLTATAAYQALLGNVSVAKTVQKSAPSSDSDSEDEIENVLANVVRRTSHITFDAATLDPKTEKRKESIAEIKAERKTRSADSVTTNKPQNKLSKNTRKVLGLDTSSGSEVELEVKSPSSKIEEESDEFDFYN